MVFSFYSLFIFECFTIFTDCYELLRYYDLKWLVIFLSGGAFCVETLCHPTYTYWFDWPHSEIPSFACVRLTSYLTHRLPKDILVDTS